jgi:LPXTG-motif cell wall-anchored protein
MSVLRRVVRFLIATLVVASAALLSPGMATAAEVHYVAQETTPEGVVLPDEEEGGQEDSGQDAQEDEGAEQEADEQEAPADDGGQDDDASSDRDESAGGSGGDGGMPNTGPETIPLTLIGLMMLASGLVLRKKTRRRRRMRW